jgi:hypothetical protein
MAIMVFSDASSGKRELLPKSRECPEWLIAGKNTPVYVLGRSVQCHKVNTAICIPFRYEEFKKREEQCTGILLPGLSILFPEPERVTLCVHAVG